MKRLITHTVLITSMLATWTFAQAPASRTAEFEKRSRDIEAKELAIPFKGITAKGSIEPGLFAVKSTGASTQPARVAAERVRAHLTQTDGRTATLGRHA